MQTLFPNGTRAVVDLLNLHGLLVTAVGNRKIKERGDNLFYPITANLN